jgi:hypothetical protein
MKSIHYHTDVFRETDHGYAWVEYYWLEVDGVRRSAVTPHAACCQRLGDMPGGPIRSYLLEDKDRWQPEREVRSTTEHLGFWKIGACSMTPV